MQFLMKMLAKQNSIRLDTWLKLWIEQRYTHLESIVLYHHNPQEKEDNDNKQRKAFIARVVFILAQRLSNPVKYKYSNIGISTGN